MSFLLSLRRQTIPFLDAFVWYAYLFLLVVISFLNDYYSSQAWLLLSAFIYVLCGLCVCSAINGGLCNWRGLNQAKYVIIILCAMLLLLWLQITLPRSQYSDLLLLDNPLFNGEVPMWFEPPGRWSIVPNKTRWLLNSEALVFSILVLSIALLSSHRRLKQLLYVVLFVGLFHSMVGIFTKYVGIILVEVEQLDGSYSATRGWFINRNHYAAFVSLCLLGALAFQLKDLISHKQKFTRVMIIDQINRYKVISLVAFIIGMIALVLSQSRAGFIAFLVSFFCVSIVVGRGKLINALRFSRRKLLIKLTVIVVVVIGFFGAELMLRFSADSLLGERSAQWALSLASIKQAWILGYGGNSYADVFQVVRGYQDFRQVLYNQSHNDYLHILLEQGLLGLTLWLGLLMLVFRAAYTAITNTTSSLVISTLVSVMVVLFAALLQSGVDFNLQILNIRCYFFVIMSLAFSVPCIGPRKGSP